MKLNKMKRLTTKDKQFIEHVKVECKKAGIKADLRNVGYVKLGPSIRCSGYFDEVSKTLVCAMNKVDSLEILLHEYGHFTQWQDQCKAWTNLGDSIDMMHSWLDGEEVENIEHHIKISRDVEIDNEKRAVKLIDKFGLSINKDTYIKRANAYILFYNHMLTVRRWCRPNNMPYENKRVVAVMPNNFKMNYNKIPKRLMKIYQEENV